MGRYLTLLVDEAWRIRANGAYSGLDASGCSWEEHEIPTGEPLSPCP